MKLQITVGLIGIVVLGIIIIGLSYTPSTESTQKDNYKLIGALFPITGDLSSHGEESKISAKLAVSDFNDYLDEKDADWNLKIVIEDTATNPVIALEKLTSLNAKNIHVIVGPQSSAELRNIKGYADNNGLIIFSPSSTSTSLAIPNDNIFRLVTDNSKQSPVLSKLFSDRGMKVIIPIYRGDAWGDSLYHETKLSLENNNNIFDDGVRYNPETPDFSPTISLLNEKVSMYLETYDSKEIGVLSISFAESLLIMQSASQYDVLDDVKWFGSDGITGDIRLVEDKMGLEFAEKTNFTSVETSFSDNQIYKSVKNRINDSLGRTPNAYAFSTYDIVWLLGLAIEESNSSDIGEIKSTLVSITENYQGAIGSTKLNEAGDLTTADYDIWSINNGEWVIVGKYYTDTDLLINKLD